MSRYNKNLWWKRLIFLPPKFLLNKYDTWYDHPVQTQLRCMMFTCNNVTVLPLSFNKTRVDKIYRSQIRDLNRAVYMIIKEKIRTNNNNVLQKRDFH